MHEYLKKINWKIIAVVFFILIIIISVLIYTYDDFSLLDSNSFRESKLNILIAGYDSSDNGPPRADAIIVASINLKTNNIGFLFIPRDTRVKINGRGHDRINASYAYGGIKLTKETVEDFLNIKLDYYVETGFEGFANIINLIGGINLHIDKQIRFGDKTGDFLPAGDVHLDGKKALQYVRYRGKQGDIGRVSRQQKFIQAVMEKVISSQSISNLPSIYKEVVSSVNTNIPVEDLTLFVKLTKNTDVDSIKTEMVPGTPKYINKASYWIPDEDSLKVIVDDLIRSK